MASKNQQPSKKAGLLVDVAESIGDTLGTIAAKASAVPDALLHSSLSKRAPSEGKKVVRKSKVLGRKALQRSTKRKARRSHRGTTSKRVARPVAVKKLIARGRRTKK